MSILIPRRTWGSTYDYAKRHLSKPANPVKIETCLHHSVTIAPDLIPPFTDEYAAMRELERIGTSRFGSGMSYNAAVMPNGRAYEGQPLYNKSTHSDYGDWNYTRASIVIVGNADKTPLTAAQEETIAKIQAEWKKAGTIGRVALRWHAQTKATACPGRYAIARIPAIVRRALQILEPPPLPVVKLALLIDAARPATKTRPATPWAYRTGTALVQKALRKEGLIGFYVPGRFGNATRRAYSKWQQRCGYTGDGANGIPGVDSLTRLGAKRGFTVR